jgi:hypothetical protein
LAELEAWDLVISAAPLDVNLIEKSQKGASNFLPLKILTARHRDK